MSVLDCDGRRAGMCMQSFFCRAALSTAADVGCCVWVGVLRRGNVDKERWERERSQLHAHLTAEKENSRQERYALQNKLQQLWREKALLDNQVLSLQSELRKRDRGMLLLGACSDEASGRAA